MTEQQVVLLDWDRRMGLHSLFPACCVSEWCENIVAANHDTSSDLLWGITAEKKAAMGRVASQVFFVPCWSCVRKLASGVMKPPQTHRCLQGNIECEALWREAERLTGYVHRILRIRV